MSSLRRYMSVVAATAFAWCPFVANAQFTNPGFENPLPPAGGYTIYTGGNSFNGWTVLGNDVLLLSSSYTEPNGVGNATLTFNSHSGLSSMDLTGNGNTGTGNGVQQSIATTFGQSYTLSFWLGKATGNGYYAIPSTLDLSINGGSRVSFTNSNNNPNVIDWQQHSYVFVATGASTLVTFYNGTASGSNNMVGLDDVSISSPTSAVPEPASVALLASGLVCVAGVARRRVRAG